MNVRAIRMAVTQQKVCLLALLAVVLTIMLITEHSMPQLSGVVLVYTFLISYTGLQSLAQWHHKRQARRQAVSKPGLLMQATFSQEDVDSTTWQPKVAVVVPAHNEAAVLPLTVMRLQQLTYPSLTLWLMDDRSTDDTPAVIARLAPEDNRIHWISRPYEATPGKSAVLNDALRVINAEVIAVFDADAQMAPDFIEQMLPFLQDERVGAVQARKRMVNANQTLLTRCQQYEYALDTHFQSGRDVVSGAVELRGNGQLVKRKALESVGGWNEATLTDDLDLSTRLHLAGWDVRFAPNVSIGEEAIPTFRALLRQRRRWAEGSLVRHLTYGTHLLTSPHVSLRATVDMIAWFTQFLLPFWLICDYAVLLVSGLSHANRFHLVSSLLILPLMSCFFTVSLLIGIQRFERLDWLRASIWACITGVYMTLVWIPIVFQVMVRILLQRQDATLDWGKTDHHGNGTDTVAGYVDDQTGPLTMS